MHAMQVAGAEVLVKQIIERLDGTIDATIFCLDDIGELGQQLIDAGTPVVVLGREPGMDWAVAKRLASEIRTREIDVLHAHQYTPFFYSALARLRHRASVKIIFTEHGRHFPDVVSRKRRLANQLFLRRYADVTTACCDFSTTALQSIEGFSRAFTLRNGVDLQTLPSRGNHSDVLDRRKQLGLNPDTPYAACIARFHPIKDHAMLIRGWALVHEQLPDAKLLLVGDGPERAAIEDQVAAAGLSDCVEFWGIRGDVGEILRAVDVFTLTSISEAASLTLLEAMASNCASVITDVGGNAEHLRESIDGFLVPRGDEGELADRLVKLLSDKSLRETFGKSARQHIADHFSLDDAVTSYAIHYQTQANLLNRVTTW